MQLDWSEVTVDSVVLLKGKPWIVMDRDGASVTVHHHDGRQLLKHTGTPSGLVEVTRLAHNQNLKQEMAIAAVQILLGGSVQDTGRKNERGEHILPVTYPDVASAQAHLSLFHGGVIESHSIRDVLGEHAARHRPDRKDARYIPHVHDPS